MLSPLPHNMSNQYLVFCMYIDDRSGKYAVAHSIFSCDGFPENVTLEYALTKTIKEKANIKPRGMVNITGIIRLNKDETDQWYGRKTQ